MTNIIEFPTDIVRAEAEIDRAHERWLQDRREKYSNLFIDMSILYDKSHKITSCTYFNKEIADLTTGYSEYYPSTFRQVDETLYQGF